MKKWILPLVALMLFGCSSSDNDVPRRAIQYIEVAEQGKGQLRRISGVVEAGNEAELSFQVAGNVASVAVASGDAVAIGQTLATLDDKPYHLNVDAAKAELTKAQAIQAEKKSDYDAKSTLFEKKFVSKTVLDNARAEYEAAQQNIESAKAKYALALRDLDNTVLKAPFAGDIASRNVDAGMNVAVGQPVFKLLGKEGFEVSVSLPETLRKDVKLGSLVDIAFPSLHGPRRKGEVTEIAVATDTGNAFTTKISVNETVGLYPGLTAEVWFELHTEKKGETYLIPASALITSNEPGFGYVFVYDPKTETVKKTRISVKDIRENSVEVTAGLHLGDKVATAGVHFLTDGQAVTLYREP
ncbi:MAG: efflux RND transporter periplasmic adaptor subunit [Gammaproteobacteria bacterium]